MTVRHPDFLKQPFTLCCSVPRGLSQPPSRGSCPLGPGTHWPPELACHRPDGERRVSGVPPVFRGADVHAPQLPAVPMGRVLIPLHLKGVLFDVVDGREDHSLPVLLDAGENRLGPETEK